MKTNDPKELKPVYIHEMNYSTDDEISLIDLAIVLIRHKTIIAVIFTATIALGVTMTLFTPRIYTFSSTIEIGSQIINSSIQPLESPQALLAKLQYGYIPQLLIEHKQSSPSNKKKYQIKASVPKGSNILLLETKGTKEQEDILKTLLQTVSQKAIQDHNHILASVRSNLKARLKQTNNNLKSLKSGSEKEVATNQELIEILNSQLANLRNTREILPPIRSIDPTGGSRKTIIVISAITGLFLGVFTAFFTEFLSKVKQKLATDKM